MDDFTRENIESLKAVLTELNRLKELTLITNFTDLSTGRMNMRAANEAFTQHAERYRFLESEATRLGEAIINHLLNSK